jgi:hypothetical protein
MTWLAAAMLLVGASTAAQGATITQIVTYGGIPNFSRPLTFNQFDDLGGTLTLLSIKVIVGLDADGGRLILDNDAAGAAAGTFEFGAKAAISSVDVSLPVLGNLAAVHTEAFALDPNIGDGLNDYDPSAPDGLAYNGVPETDSKSGFVAPADYGAYMGIGTYDITLDATQWQTFGGIGGIEWAVSPVTTSGAVTVVYTYVPEPATLSFLALGGLGLLLRRKR